jgi:hypothetical protein
MNKKGHFSVNMLWSFNLNIPGFIIYPGLVVGNIFVIFLSISVFERFFSKFSGISNLTFPASSGPTMGLLGY